MIDTTNFSHSHIGRKIERIRKIRDIKQETLANALGISRQSLSKLEQSETIDEEKLTQIANALGVPVEIIKNLNEDAAIQNIFQEQCTGFNFHCTFNPIEKIVELYERMLSLEKEKNELLQKLLDKKNAL